MLSLRAGDASLPVGVSSHSMGGGVTTIVLNRVGVRNCVDGPTARDLHRALVAADADASTNAIVLYGAGGTFCAGADLTAVSAINDGGTRANPLTPVAVDDGTFSTTLVSHTSDIGPMGATRLVLSKPVIAAISGHAVAGGLELACWADLRVAESDAIFGVFCRRFGVPLIDGGTVRLPKIVGMSRAMDIILTGRPVDAQEALSWGLVNRVVPIGCSRSAAESLARELSQFPQRCLRADRWSALHAHSHPTRVALAHEFAGALPIVRDESVRGAKQFVAGKGRHGAFETPASGRSMLVANATAATTASSATLPIPTGPYKCVLFDLGGVVVDSPIGEILEYEKSLRLPPHSINLLLAKSPAFHALERGELDLVGFAPRFEAEAREKGLAGVDATKLFELMGRVRPRPAMLDAIAALRRAGIVVCAVTNNWKTRQTDERGAMMDAMATVFDDVVESAVVNLRKPDPRIFQLALERCEDILKLRADERNRQAAGGSSSSSSAARTPLSPKSVAFLDDLGINLKSAQSFGLHTIKVTRDFDRALRTLATDTGVDLGVGTTSGKEDRGQDANSSANGQRDLEVRSML